MRATRGPRRRADAIAPSSERAGLVEPSLDDEHLSDPGVGLGRACLSARPPGDLQQLPRPGRHRLHALGEEERVAQAGQRRPLGRVRSRPARHPEHRLEIRGRVVEARLGEPHRSPSAGGGRSRPQDGSRRPASRTTGRPSRSAPPPPRRRRTGRRCRRRVPGRRRPARGPAPPRSGGRSRRRVRGASAPQWWTRRAATSRCSSQPARRPRARPAAPTGRARGRSGTASPACRREASPPRSRR